MTRWILLGGIAVYRAAISPFLPPRCRFQPSCSAYAMEAISRHGALRGGALALKRVLRCHPWGGFGYDPVPKMWPAAAGTCCGPVTEPSDHLDGPSRSPAKEPMLPIFKEPTAR